MEYYSLGSRTSMYSSCSSAETFFFLQCEYLNKKNNKMLNTFGGSFTETIGRIDPGV